MRTALTIIMAAMLMASCGKDDEAQIYPPVSMEFATIGTGTGGGVELLYTDDGGTYLVHDDKTGSRLNPSSNYRVVTTYQPLTMPAAGTYGTADIYTLTGVFCKRSIPAIQVSGGFATDPVEVRKVWRRGNFINIELGILAQDKQHEFDFINDGREPGTDNVVIKLRHDDGDDYPAYTKTAYLSLQLTEFRQAGADSVAININTHDGWQRHAFAVD